MANPNISDARICYQLAQDRTDQGDLRGAADAYEQTISLLPGAAAYGDTHRDYASELGTTMEQLREDYSTTQFLASHQLLEKAKDPKTDPREAYSDLVEIKERMEKAGYDTKTPGYQDDAYAALGTDKDSFERLVSDRQAAMSQPAQQMAPQGQTAAPGAGRP